jgi:hypothetical protein
MPAVAQVNTHPTRAQWLAAFVAAFIEVAHVVPTQEQAGAAWGLFAEETGRGAACWNWNVMNIRAFRGYAGDVIDLPGAWEIIDDARVVTGGAFRAYPTLQAGIHGFLTCLCDDFKDAARELFQPHPNPRAVVAAMKQDGFFTGELLGYQNTVASVARNFGNELAAELRAFPPSTWGAGLEHDGDDVPPVLQCVDEPSPTTSPEGVESPEHAAVRALEGPTGTGTTTEGAVNVTGVTGGGSS